MLPSSVVWSPENTNPALQRLISLAEGIARKWLAGDAPVRLVVNGTVTEAASHPTCSAPAFAALRNAPGVRPVSRLNARLKAATES